MKLKEWATKQGISYLTAWRWYKAKDPRLANAYQSDSGTIIVPDDSDSTEQAMQSNISNDVMSLFLKKTVEFSKNNSSIEDFAAYVLSTFSLKLNGVVDGPKYSRNKPKQEEVQKHFQQFIKANGEKPKPNMFVAEPEALEDLMAKADDLTAQELVEEINKVGVEGGVLINPSDVPEMKELVKDISSVLNVTAPTSLNVKNYGDIAEGVITRSVDFTPQLNYTDSSAHSFSNNCLTSSAVISTNDSLELQQTGHFVYATNSANFQPTQKELQSVAKVSEIVDKPKRGRKPFKNIGKK